jgi:hypothetical protein
MVLSATKKPTVGQMYKMTSAADSLWVLTTEVATDTDASHLWKAALEEGSLIFRPLKTAIGDPVSAVRIIDETDIWVALAHSGDLLHTENGGVSWGTPIDTGLNYSGPAWPSGPPGIVSVNTIRGEPDYLICGGPGMDDVAWSEDGGDSWEPVDADDARGSCAASFGGGFLNPAAADYQTVWANGSPGAFRYVMDESTAWEEYIDPAGDTFSDGYTGTIKKGAVLPPMAAPDVDGTLYATTDAGELIRCLYPTDRGDFADTSTAEDYDLDGAVEYEALTGGGDDKLWWRIGRSDIRLFNRDGDDVLMMLHDTLSTPGAQTAPADGTETGRQGSATVSWSDREGADKYTVEWDEDPSYQVNPQTKTVEVPNYRITGLESGREYFWRFRVAAGDPMLSPWSEDWSFTTALGAPQWNPFMGGVPEAPANGATNVPLMPTFAWNAADWATGYEFVLADNPDFANPIISKTGANALKNTVYVSEEQLKNSTQYYWRVRAVGRSTSSEWATGVFSTEGVAPSPPPAPEPPPPAPPPPPTPFYIWVIIGVGGALVVVVIILIVWTRQTPMR